MKAIIASLMVVVALPSFAQDAPVDLLKKPVSFDGVDIEIAELFDIVGMNLKPAPNVVFKGAAGEQRVHRLRVKDVSLGSLFKVIESVAEVDIEVIDESGSAGGGNDPFAGGGSPQILTSSGVIIVSSKIPQKKGAGGMAATVVTARTSKPKPSKVETEVISLAELKIPEVALIDAIKITWNAVDPNLENQASIAFHKPSKLLIISGPREAIENAQKTAAALLPSYRELIQAREQIQASSYPTAPRQGAILDLVPSKGTLFDDSTTGVRHPAQHRDLRARERTQLQLPGESAPARGKNYSQRPQLENAFGNPENARPAPRIEEELPRPIPLPRR